MAVELLGVLDLLKVLNAPHLHLSASVVREGGLLALGGGMEGLDVKILLLELLLLVLADEGEGLLGPGIEVLLELGGLGTLEDTSDGDVVGVSEEQEKRSKLTTKRSKTKKTTKNTYISQENLHTP